MTQNDDMDMDPELRRFKADPTADEFSSRLFNLNEVAELMGVTYQRVHALVSEGRIFTLKIPERYGKDWVGVPSRQVQEIVLHRKDFAFVKPMTSDELRADLKRRKARRRRKATTRYTNTGALR